MNMNLFRVGKLRSLSKYFVASMVTALVGLFVNPLLAMGLSHTDYAIIGYYTAYGSLLTPIISFSLQSYYARNYYLLDEVDREKLLLNILSVFSTLSIVSFILFFGGYYIYHHYFVESIPFIPYALLSFSPLFLSSYYNLYLMKLRMEDKASRYAIITILNSVIGALFSVLLVYFLNYGALGRLIAILIVSIMFATYSIYSTNFRYQWDWNVIKPALKFCLPITVSGILSFFFIGVDRPMLAHIGDNYTLGLYNVGLQISAYLAIFGTVLLQTFDPELYKYTSLREHRKVFRLVACIIVATLIPNLCFIIVSKPLIGVLTAGKYVEASIFARILCLKNVTTTFAYIMSGVLIGYGFPCYELLNRAIGSFLSLIIYNLLISNYKFYGAAWGQSISWLIMGIISCCSLIIFRYARK